ncbi:MAG TPA: hypothetical protein VNH64_09155 [Parvularculaceae bacterium]|nr:hypothetical protein [Parvularculaceae bacterium]
MLKSLKIAAVATAIASAAGAAPAMGQTSNQAPTANAIMDLISAADVASMMTEMNISTTLEKTDDGIPYLVATTAGGGEFRFGFLGCKDEAQAAACQGAYVVVMLPAGGATYDSLNRFNASAFVATAINVPDNNAIALGRNIFIIGGHSRALFKTTVALFLRDVAGYIKANLGAASVSFRKPAQSPTKISPVQAEAAPSGPMSVFGVRDMKSLVSMAIANTNDVDFNVNYEPSE